MREQQDDALLAKFRMSMSWRVINRSGVLACWNRLFQNGNIQRSDVFFLFQAASSHDMKGERIRSKTGGIVMRSIQRMSS